MLAAACGRLGYIRSNAVKTDERADDQRKDCCSLGEIMAKMEDNGEIYCTRSRPGEWMDRGGP